MSIGSWSAEQFCRACHATYSHRFIGPSCTVLVVGATGATGKQVVQQLLDKGHNIKAVVRSKERLQSQLTSPAQKYGDRLSLTEASLLDLNDDQFKSLVQGTDAVVSCLGHNLDFKGIWGQPRRLVTDASKRLTAAMKESSPTSKFILSKFSSVNVISFSYVSSFLNAIRFSQWIQWDRMVWQIRMETTMRVLGSSEPFFG